MTNLKFKNGTTLHFSELENAQKFLACVKNFRADCNAGGSEWCADTFFNYISDIDTEKITDQEIKDALDL